MGMRSLNIKAFVMASITIIIWGSSFPVIRSVFQGGYTPGPLILSRYLIASALFVIFALSPWVKIRLPQKEDLLKITILGLVGISVYHIGATFGVRYVSAGTAGMLVAAAPIFTSLIAVFILKERMGVFGWLGLVLGFIGIGVISIGSSGPASGSTMGVLLLLMAAAATAVLFAYQKPLLSRYSSIELTAYFTWIGTIPFVIFFPGLLQEIQHATVAAHLSTLYIGLFPTAIAYVTWGMALSAGKSSSVTSMLYLEPLIVILVAWLWLNEWPNAASLIGGIIAIVGVIVINMLGSKQQSPAIETQGVNNVSPPI